MEATLSCRVMPSCHERTAPKAQIAGPTRTVYRRSRTTKAPRKRSFLVTMSIYGAPNVVGIEQSVVAKPVCPRASDLCPRAPARSKVLSARDSCVSRAYAGDVSGFSKPTYSLDNGFPGGNGGNSGNGKQFSGDSGNGKDGAFPIHLWVGGFALAATLFLQTCNPSQAGVPPANLISTMSSAVEGAEEKIYFGTVPMSQEEMLFYHPTQYNTREYKRIGF